MNILLKTEELAKFAVAYILSLYLGYSWWVFLAWLLAPDLSMIAYLGGTRSGAWLYNFFHHQGVAVAVGVVGLFLNVPELQLAGLIIFGHSAMDRALGYGLKFPDSFQHTHLGWIGKGKN